ncbi:hypothetical protein M404DRAFT_24722 [Pisolithus tinctorius Marx 270]|uniref:Uncharacterized protein n=1 Tax=Pisolithus tinctorius Marx 270 TaxID=870435 RepID=A0A0C3PF27_PISTI|nr:hypothetical protein M404DRAFT_24722 [Pisolithus tinctorius Marx 270]
MRHALGWTGWKGPKVDRKNIDVLVKKRPPANNLLPVELLPQRTFQSLPTLGVWKKFQELAHRSKTFVNGVTALKECGLPRSGNLIQRLNVLGPSADRWQRLHIQDAEPRILHAFEDLTFHSLKHVLVYPIPEVPAYPRFLLPNKATALRNLELKDSFPTPKFATAMTLTTLEPKLRCGRGQTTKSTFIPTQSTMILLLSGLSTGWALLPDSIHIPLREVFKLAVDNPKPVMEAIVVPKFMRLECSYPEGSR